MVSLKSLNKAGYFFGGVSTCEFRPKSQLPTELRDATRILKLIAARASNPCRTDVNVSSVGENKQLAMMVLFNDCTHKNKTEM